ncbi:phage Gp37/Gp68 family protein [Aeromicrobium panaciterrae]|uniref:DUF5131 family protein n=1 Tax=Aeromicrobium panaciterrae TaxID=363861 RepID=UPI0031D82638
MADKTGIEWTDATWNPTTGCDKVSAGCDNCYALTQAKRLKAMGSARYQNDGDPTTSGPGFGFTMHPDALDQPLRWTKPRRIFVNSMSDLFHGDNTQEFLAEVFAVMSMAPRHTFQVLTKRPAIMRSVLSSPMFKLQVNGARMKRGVSVLPDSRRSDGTYAWPLPNVWLGTSVEDQKWADIRIPLLLATPAAVRFLSCEPLLGPVDLTPHMPLLAYPDPRETEDWGIDWVIVGGESGKDVRPMHPDWARSIRDACVESGTAFLFKQWGEWAPSKVSGGTHTNPKMSKQRFMYDSVRFAPDGTTYAADPDLYSYPGMASMLRVGKRNAGRQLDGRTWDEYPEGAPS